MVIKRHNSFGKKINMFPKVAMGLDYIFSYQTIFFKMVNELSRKSPHKIWTKHQIVNKGNVHIDDNLLVILSPRHVTVLLYASSRHSVDFKFAAVYLKFVFLIDSLHEYLLYIMLPIRRHCSKWSADRTVISSLKQFVKYSTSRKACRQNGISILFQHGDIDLLPSQWSPIARSHNSSRYHLSWQPHTLFSINIIRYKLRYRRSLWTVLTTAYQRKSRFWLYCDAMGSGGLCDIDTSV